MAMPAWPCSVSSSRICRDGHVDGGGRLVGDQEVRIARERHGDQDALAHTADSWCGYSFTRRSAWECAQLGMSTVLSLHRGAEALVQPDGLRDLLTHRDTGLSDVIGSWKIIAISLPRIFALRGRDRGGSCFVEDLALDDPAREAADQAHD